MMKHLMFMAAAAMTAASASLANAAVVFDGVADAEYVVIATDPRPDLAPGPASWSGVAWTDLSVLKATNDATHLYIHVAMPDYSAAGSFGSWGLAIDVNGTPAGGGSDPWGNAITYVGANLPDFHLRGNTPADGGWTELRVWDSDWSNGAGVNVADTHVAWADGEGLELKIPLATLGVGEGDTVNLLFFGTQTGDTKGAYDALGDSNQATDWDTPTSHSTYASYTIAAVPEPTGVAVIGGLGLIALGVRRRSA